MADAYIDETYVRAHMGTALESALVGIAGTSLTTLIEAATARVQAALRNSGYSTPSTTTDEMVKLAVFGVVREMVSDIPEASLPLPDDWRSRATNPMSILKEIISGEVQLSGHTLTTAAAVGGWQMSSHADTAAAYPQRTSRQQLKGY